MTVRLSADGIVELEGRCPVEDGATLQRYLIENPQATVDWSRCEHAHTSVVQILLARRPTLRGQPAGDFLREHVAPLLSASER